MRKYLHLLFSLLLFACRKSSSEPDQENFKVDPSEITHKVGEGAVIFGSQESKSNSVLLEIFKEGEKKAIATTLVYSFIDIKSPVNCKIVDKRVRVVKLPVGKYRIEIDVQPNAAAIPSQIMNIEIKDGTCKAINLNGYAW